MSFVIDYRLAYPIALDVQFEIRGFTALLGKSGAGKTSLLKALAGLLPATGTPWQGLPPQSRPVGYLPQGIYLFPHLSVLENAAFALTGPSRLTTAQKLLDDLGVGHLAPRNAAKISGGEAQRVALARALARRPALLLLDEPSAALDAATREDVLAQLANVVSTSFIAALAATHDATVAGLADWVVILAGGRIIQQGPPAQVFAAPYNKQAALLLGYQNFFEQNGQSCAIRAEDIAIGEEGVAAVITAIRPQGQDLRLVCTPSGGQSPFVVVRCGEQKSRNTIGQSIKLHLPPDKIKFLQSSSA